MGLERTKSSHSNRQQQLALMKSTTLTSPTSGCETAAAADSPSLSPVNVDGNGDGIGDIDEEHVEVAHSLMLMGAGEPVLTKSRSGGEEQGQSRAAAATFPDLSFSSPSPDGGKSKRDASVREDEEEEHGGTNSSSAARTDDDIEKEQGGKKRSIGMALKAKVLHFTPSWFSVTMGTGVIASLFTLLGQIWGTEQYSPFFRSFMRWPALVFLLLDIGIFIIFSAAFLARYYMFPQVLPLTIKHSQKSMFLGTIPMGLITITSNISSLGTNSFGLGIWPTFAAVGLWFFCCILSTVVAIGVPWSIVTYQKEHRFEATTAALLLPVVPPITAAATGSVLTENLLANHPTLAFVVWNISYMQLGIGLPLALMILVLYLQRLILFKAPPREVIVSVFLPLGPCGQGGEAALHLGGAALGLFPNISSSPTTGVPQLTIGVGQAVYGAGLVTALMLFALGMWWAVIGTATFSRQWFKGHIKFNMGFWSFTFPLASLAICTARLAIELDSLTLKIVYTAMVLLNFALWVSVAVPTVKGFCSGSLLIAPCIASLPLDPLKPTQ